MVSLATVSGMDADALRLGWWGWLRGRGGEGELITREGSEACSGGGVVGLVKGVCVGGGERGGGAGQQRSSAMSLKKGLWSKLRTCRIGLNVMLNVLESVEGNTKDSTRWKKMFQVHVTFFGKVWKCSGNGSVQNINGIKSIDHTGIPEEDSRV